MVVVGTTAQADSPGSCWAACPAKVAAHAKCPTVVVRPPVADMDGIVVGVDGSEHSLKALEWAFEQASFAGLPLHVVHSWEIPPTWSMVEVPSYEPEVLIRDYGNTELRETSEAMADSARTSRTSKVRQEVMKGFAREGSGEGQRKRQHCWSSGPVGSAGSGPVAGFCEPRGGAQGWLHGGCRTVRVCA